MKLRPALLYFLALTLLCAGLEHALAAAPVVSNVRSVQRAGTQLVDIDYDLADPDSATLAVMVIVSANGGPTSFTRQARSSKRSDSYENK